MFDIKEILTLTLTLFAVIDILGSIPVILSLREKLGHIQSEKASIAAAILMVAFLFIGEILLGLIGLDVYSFALAGSVVIFILGLEMVLGVEFFKGTSNPSTGSIVPIAFPLVAGAGTLTSIISLKAAYSNANLLVAILLNVIIVYIVLKSTKYIERKIGSGGIEILRRVFGVILLAIAIKLAKNNISSWL